MRHQLDPLLRPRSVAIVGASARPDSMGEWSLENLIRGGFTGSIYPVNPKYRELRGKKCHASLKDLPEVPDLVIFALSDARMEQALDEAIARRVPAVLLMSALVMDNDSRPTLRERVRKKIHGAGILACGANGMGFYNVRDRVWACGFDSRLHVPPGNVSYISHSGAGMCGIVDCDERIRFNFAVSTGFEIGVTMDQYLDFVLGLPETRVVGLFVETARNPEGFRAALEKAQARRIPIVALKVGRTEKSAQLTVSHSGAMAGDDAAYDSLFDRYGVQRVRDMDELATALILFSECHPVGPGGLATLHDSGGERQLLVDLAADAGVSLTDLSDESVDSLEKILDPELPAVNPLDAWSRGGEEAADRMAAALAIMMQDPGVAIAAVVHDRGPEGHVYPGYVEYLRRGRSVSGKPAVLVAARQGSGCDGRIVKWTHEGFPVLDGVAPFLCGVRALLSYRDHLAAPPMRPPKVPENAVIRWRAQLRAPGALDESRSLSMLRDFGIPANSSELADNEQALIAAAEAFHYPLVLKSAVPGLMHKTEHEAVALDLADENELRSAYRRLAARLGPRVLVAPMISGGIEMILGSRRDPQFGPVILLGFGGVHAEVFQDVTFILPPFDAAEARRKLDRLAMRALLDGQRGEAPADVAAFCDTAARFSSMVHALREEVQEIDVNPLVVTRNRCIAVDALV
ncbi:MAG: acetate--CoA ligase family protein, partial [Woeseia sp.]